MATLIQHSCARKLATAATLCMTAAVVSVMLKRAPMILVAAVAAKTVGRHVQAMVNAAVDTVLRTGRVNKLSAVLENSP